MLIHSHVYKCREDDHYCNGVVTLAHRHIGQALNGLSSVIHHRPSIQCSVVACATQRYRTEPRTHQLPAATDTTAPVGHWAQPLAMRKLVRLCGLPLCPWLDRNSGSGPCRSSKVAVIFLTCQHPISPTLSLSRKARPLLLQKQES
jgi:hypothetical protein